MILPFRQLGGMLVILAAAGAARAAEDVSSFETGGEVNWTAVQPDVGSSAFH